MTGPQLIALTDAELGTLHGAGPLAVALYIALRHQMDYRTGEVGRSTPISLHGLARGNEARPGESWQQFRHRIFTTRPTAEGSRA